MARNPWWRGTAAQKYVRVQNFRNKISLVGPAIGLTPAEITAAIAWCDAYLGAFDAVEACRTQMQAMTAWRDEVFTGESKGTPVSKAPVFPVIGAVDYEKGSLTQFMELRDLIVSMKGYTLSYGEELGIVGTEIVPRPVVDASPLFKSVTFDGNTVTVSGSMKKFTAMQMEYAQKGGVFRTVGFLTKTPGSFTIQTATPGIAETGQIRASFIEDNEKVGRYSPNYPVTLV